MDQEILFQEMRCNMREQTLHLVEAMQCKCDIVWVDSDGYVRHEGVGQTCNRCNKLEELQKK